MCSYVEKYDEFKNQILEIRWYMYKNWLYAKEYPWGDPYFKIGENEEILYQTPILTYLAPPEPFLMDAKLIVPWVLLNAKNNVLKNKTVWAV